MKGPHGGRGSKPNHSYLGKEGFDLHGRDGGKKAGGGGEMKSTGEALRRGGWGRGEGSWAGLVSAEPFSRGASLVPLQKGRGTKEDPLASPWVRTGFCCGRLLLWLAKVRWVDGWVGGVPAGVPSSGSQKP